MRAWTLPLATVLLAAAAPDRPEPTVGLPLTGQPAADVLASHDGWGHPTFVGGLTNSGPTSHSVW